MCLGYCPGFCATKPFLEISVIAIQYEGCAGNSLLARVHSLKPDPHCLSAWHCRQSLTARTRHEEEQPYGSHIDQVHEQPIFPCCTSGFQERGSPYPKFFRPICTQ